MNKQIFARTNKGVCKALKQLRHRFKHNFLLIGHMELIQHPEELEAFYSAISLSKLTESAKTDLTDMQVALLEQDLDARRKHALADLSLLVTKEPATADALANSMLALGYDVNIWTAGERTFIYVSEKQND